MFDRLIESDTVGAEFKSRRRYFIVSSVVVGALFLSAVVFSIYASEVGLGNDTYELTALLTPVQPPAEAPEPPQPQDRQHQSSNQKSDDLASRAIAQQRPDETPAGIPPVSTSRNTNLSRPYGDYRINGIDFNPAGSNGVAMPGPDSGKPSASATGYNGNDDRDETRTETAPPPVEKPKPPRSIGVANGYATYLPKPEYPRTAVALGIQDKVDVQITIDETGKVTSAKAISGNPLLRQVAEKAALNAKFKPTTLSNVPVRVTGVIVYNFTRN